MVYYKKSNTKKAVIRVLKNRKDIKHIANKEQNVSSSLTVIMLNVSGLKSLI